MFFSAISPFSTAQSFSAASSASNWAGGYSPGFDPFQRQTQGYEPESSAAFGTQLLNMVFMAVLFQFIRKLQDKLHAQATLPTPEEISFPPDTGEDPGDNGDTPSPGEMITKNDILNYFLGASKGETEDESERVESRFANPNSKFANAGQDQFDAMIAEIYLNQFKGFVLGKDVYFHMGDDPSKLADNVLEAMRTPFNAEAELFGRVAAIYRGELTGQINQYDDPALKQVLIKWGRNDLAEQPFVGVQGADVETLGSVMKALQEEPDAAKRKAMLQDIFDFANNTPSSPFHAVPNLVQYQKAIDIARNGTLARLLQEYRNNIRTSEMQPKA